MGVWVKPYYGKETVEKYIKTISAIDEKINALLIEREQYVEEFEKAIEAENTAEA